MQKSQRIPIFFRDICLQIRLAFKKMKWGAKYEK